MLQSSFNQANELRDTQKNYMLEQIKEIVSPTSFESSSTSCSSCSEDDSLVQMRSLLPLKKRVNVKKLLFSILEEQDEQ